MQYVDYYKTLGVSRDTDQAEIKKAYRRLARKYHPDVSKEKDAESRFKEIGEAYEVLKDPEKRSAYDQLGANWKSGQEFHTPPDWGSHFDFGGGGASGANFSDFFESIFGGGFGRQSQGGFSGFNQHSDFSQRGQDLSANISISLKQAFNQEKVGVRLGNGRTLSVRIPAGVKDGQKIRLAGQGSAGAGGGANGDLFIAVNILSHPHFILKDRNIELTVPISPWEAALGAEITVPTLSGKVQLKVPAGSTSGKKVRMKGRGMPVGKGTSSGDFFIRFEVAVPPANNKSQRELYEKMQQSFDFEPREKLNAL